jgi:hypothetical protein
MSRESISLDGLRRSLPEKAVRTGWILLLGGLALVVAGYMIDPVRSAFMHNVLFLYLTSLAAGGVFLVALEYITGAVWSVPMRRVSEYLAVLVPVAAVVGIPLFLSLHDLFHWTHEEAVAADKILQSKAPYLNVEFFTIRYVVFFALLSLFAWLFLRNSIKQDETKDQKLTAANGKLAAGFIPLFAIIITFIAIDWAMSLEPHWFSTIYGVYYFSGTVVAVLAAVTLIALQFMDAKILPALRRDHLYSLGALMFAFLNFWAYIAFSQFMLIWYANLPEETFWFIMRWENGWEYFSVALILLRFAVPYLVLLPQDAKMDPKRLKFSAIWLLVAHFADLVWLVLPTHDKTLSFAWFDIGYPALLVGIVIVLLSIMVKRRNPVPVGDPKLQRALEFHL